MFLSPPPQDAKALAQAGFRSGDGRGGGTDDAEAAARREQADVAKQGMLKQILTAEAKDRLSRVAMVKPDNARAIEEHVIRLARAGKLQDRIDESTLIKMLEDIAAQVAGSAGGAGKVTKVTIQRRKGNDSDEDNDDDL